MRLKEEVRQIPGYACRGALRRTRNDADGGGSGRVGDGDRSPSISSGRARSIRRAAAASSRTAGSSSTTARTRPRAGLEDWWEPYPYLDAEGRVADEPVIHRISYTVNPDPEGDDLGLVERIIDLQRTINDCWNKILEIKNRALLLQMLAPRGSMCSVVMTLRALRGYYNPITGGKPEWEPAPTRSSCPAQGGDAGRHRPDAVAGGDIDVQADARLSEGTANAAIQQSQNRWQSFLGDLAEFHSRLMRHCLVLVARYYTAERQIQIRGQYGWQPLGGVRRQDMRSQVNVRVLPGA
jgi:hypothetical protein